MSVTTCPACGSGRLATYPITTGAQRRVFRCRQCQLAGWQDRDTLELPKSVGLDEISLEDRRAWRDKVRQESGPSWTAALESITSRVGAPAGRRLYDIGSGDGSFPARARDAGFTAGGNELMEAGILLAREEFGLELDLGDISTLDIPLQDVITLWCVIAHVDSPRDLLASCFENLSPGGLLYLQTPHRTWVDQVAISALRATGGRGSKLVDRRVAQHHWILSTKKSMTTMLAQLGYVDIEVKPTARYSLNPAAYAASMGIHGTPQKVVAGTAEAIIKSGIAPRIVLDVWARKPGHLPVL